ncbi:MAG TPA: hypothetical protein VN849_11490 [Stellaceae bacterium]|nr:hypothetical protein [Stellaceae bacterium]
MRAQGTTVPADLLAHVAPLGWEHIGPFTGSRLTPLCQDSLLQTWVPLARRPHDDRERLRPPPTMQN